MSWSPGSPAWPPGSSPPDRKSTRLNSSHSQISYAVFCLKKKKKNFIWPSHYSLRVMMQTIPVIHLISETSWYVLALITIADVVSMASKLASIELALSTSHHHRYDYTKVNNVSYRYHCRSIPITYHIHTLYARYFYTTLLTSFSQDFFFITNQQIFFFFFFFNDPAPPEIYPLPLHAPLPIPRRRRSRSERASSRRRPDRELRGPPVRRPISDVVRRGRATLSRGRVRAAALRAVRPSQRGDHGHAPHLRRPPSALRD